MHELLRFQPIYQHRVWGGRGLESVLGRQLPPQARIGESWEIVDRPEAQSVIDEGTMKGQSLRTAIEKGGREIMGPGWPTEKPFPILVKWLDCHERLSLQVHPPAAVAAEFEGEPKTENWYIAQAKPGAELIVGLKRGVTREQFERAIASNALEQCVHHFGVEAGDSILVRSGQVHAIDSGNLILEIQQNSDTTYRVYDWGRVGLDGVPRQLHIPQSLRSIDWGDVEPAPVRAAPTSGVIAECTEFRIRRVVLQAGEQLHIEAGEQPRLVSVVNGRVGATAGKNGGAPPSRARTLVCGDNVLAPFGGAFSLLAESVTILLVTENFVG